MRSRGTRATAILLAVLLLSFSSPVSEARSAPTYEEYAEMTDSYSAGDIPAYRDYLALLQPEGEGAEITLNADSFIRYEEDGEDRDPTLYQDYGHLDGAAVYTAENGLIEYAFTVEEPGLYDIALTYYPVEGKSAEIQRSIFLDGAIPYQELSLVQFSRIWSNTQAIENPENPVWERDNQGNDRKPSMQETPGWVTGFVYDSEGYISEPLSLYLSKGEHTLTLMSLREPMLLRGITLTRRSETASYAETTAAYMAEGYSASTGQQIVIQAENASRTSSQMLYPLQDASSPDVTPSSAKLMLNNSIGGNTWRLAGQWIEWDFTVEQSGLYNIGLHVRQSLKKGIVVSRKITIDGKSPFKELESYGFAYRQSWTTETLSDADGKPYQIYLEAGEHTLRMEAVLGNFAELIGSIRDTVYDLNAIYRKVIRLTGVAPDPDRDYQIESSLPGLREELAAVRTALDSAISRMRELAGRTGDHERVLITMRDQLVELEKDAERFNKVLGSFKVNVRACGNWVGEAILQPLQLDELYIYSPDSQPEPARKGFFAKLWFEIQRLFYSFTINYNKIGNTSDSAEAISLWVGTGRDQAGVIKSLIDESFTPQHDIAVNVMLVDINTLLQATLAGQGPDAAIQVSGELPVNYGLRNAVADLSVYPEIDEIRARFHESAMAPYEFGGATYGLPETQVYSMMFYRKDILHELGLSLPNTWDDVKVAMAVLAQNQMEFGMLPSEQTFAMLLYQNGGQYYNNDATRSALDSAEAINAFRIYCEMYTDYKLDKETSVEERFRTGETPIIIADYTTYNNLQVSAPDLKGLWGFAPVPGTVQADGSIDRTSAVYGTACVMMNASKNKEGTWKLLQWWTSAETQLLFGREMEGLMGSAARIPTANLQAFDQLSWPVADFRALISQRESIRAVPQVPGGYYSYRNVNNAFYLVTTGQFTSGVSKRETPREALTDNVILINDEIRYKRREFGMPLYEPGGDRDG